MAAVLGKHAHITDKKTVPADTLSDGGGGRI